MMYFNLWMKNIDFIYFVWKLNIRLLILDFFLIFLDMLLELHDFCHGFYLWSEYDMNQSINLVLIIHLDFLICFGISCFIVKFTNK